MERTELRLAPTTVARTVLVVMALVMLALLLWAGRNVLFVLFSGLLVGIFLSYFTHLLEERGLPRIPALLLVLVAVASLVASSSMLLWPTVRGQLSTVGQELPLAVGQIGTWVQDQYVEVMGNVVDPDADVEEDLRQRVRGQVDSLVGGAIPVINSALGALAGLLVVIAVGVYTAARPGVYRQGFERLIPPGHRDRVTRTLDAATRSLRQWMVGTVINMVLVGLLTWTGLRLLDIPAAVALAVIASLFEFVPIVGPILASIPAIAVALTVSPITALWVALLYVVIQQVEGNVITPLVMRGMVHLPPALTVLFQSFMAVVFGFLGLFLAVPLLAVVIVAVDHLYVEPMEGRG